MTGLGDERTRCATRPLPADVPPAGDATPLPPPIQEAERRVERRARTTGSRWGLRVLVVGGLAGAAWLFTGAAAHAADRSDEPTGTLLGSVVDGDVIAPVSGLLTAATRPLEAVPAHHRHHVVADILEVPQRVLTRPVETIDEVTYDATSGTTVDAAPGDVDTVLGEVAGPLRLDGGPADVQHGPVVTDDVTTVDTEPVAERPRQTAVSPSPEESPEIPVVSVSPPSIAALPSVTAVPEIGVPAWHKATSATLAHRHPVVHRTTAGPATTREDTPGGDGPAPLQLHLGDVSGTSTSGSGVRTEGGSAAFLPAAIASSTLASQRLLIASDVEVRRHDAEAPTVSPD